MSLINIKRTLQTAEGTLELLIANYKTWAEFLTEYPDEAPELFASIMGKASVLCRGSNPKSQYYVKTQGEGECEK